jgi:hypothetical protein
MVITYDVYLDGKHLGQREGLSPRDAASRVAFENPQISSHIEAMSVDRFRTSDGHFIDAVYSHSA